MQKPRAIPGMKPLKLSEVMRETEALIARQLMSMGIDPENIDDPVVRDAAEYKMLMAMPRILNHHYGIGR